jgi:hypothetical protein
VAVLEAGWKPLKSGSGAEGLVGRSTARSWAARSVGLMSATWVSRSRAMVTSTSIRYATELRVVPIVVMNRTVFLEVLLICTP